MAAEAPFRSPTSWTPRDRDATDAAARKPRQGSSHGERRGRAGCADRNCGSHARYLPKEGRHQARAPRNDDEARQMEKAEKAGKARAKGEDPALRKGARTKH